MSNFFLHSPNAIAHHLCFHLEPSDPDGDSVVLILCDEQNQVLAHCHVDDIPSDLSTADCAGCLSPIVCLLSLGGDGAVLLALTRPGPAMVVPADVRWFLAARQVCARYRMRLLGVYVVTPGNLDGADHRTRFRQVSLDDAL